jgi:hypothetical protein
VNKPVNRGNKANNWALVSEVGRVTPSDLMPSSAIPDKRVRYFKAPSSDVLGGVLNRRFPAMPAEVRTRAIQGWTKAVEKSGGRSRDGGVMLEWQASFCTYSNACWANSRMRA